MMIIPNKSIRKYVAFENGKWIHDPQMPDEMKNEFNKFIISVKEIENEKKRHAVGDDDIS